MYIINYLRSQSQYQNRTLYLSKIEARRSRALLCPFSNSPSPTRFGTRFPPLARWLWLLIRERGSMGVSCHDREQAHSTSLSQHLAVPALGPTTTTTTTTLRLRRDAAAAGQKQSLARSAAGCPARRSQAPAADRNTGRSDQVQKRAC